MGITKEVKVEAILRKYEVELALTLARIRELELTNVDTFNKLIKCGMSPAEAATAVREIIDRVTSNELEIVELKAGV